MATKTLADIEQENTAAALRGDPAMVYALLDALRRSREGLSEPEIAEARVKAEALLKDQQSNGALSEIKAQQGSAKR